MIARDGRQAGLLRLSHRRVQRPALRHVRGAELGGPRGLRHARRRQARLLGARRRPRARLSAVAGHQRALPADRRAQTGGCRAPGMDGAHPRCSSASTPPIAGYQALAERCRSIIDLQVQGATDPADGLEQQAESLGRLSWMYLRLLLARRTIGQVIGGAQNDAELQRRIAALERQQGQLGLSEDLARPGRPGRDPESAHRSPRRGRPQARPSSTPRLERIEQQVELIREQAALSTDPAHAVAAHRRDHGDARRRRRSGFAISSRSSARWTTC